MELAIETLLETINHLLTTHSFISITISIPRSNSLESPVVLLANQLGLTQIL